MLFDLSELDRMASRFRWFGYNRPALISFFDRDHGPRDSTALRDWAQAKLAAAGLCFELGRVEILCMPRVLNHVFNPLSVWFCRDVADQLSALIYEVNNTFGETHAYVLPVDDPDADLIVQTCEKVFYVSPLMDMALSYEFRVRPAGDRASVAIIVRDGAREVLTAAFAGDRMEISDAALFGAWLSHPLLSLKVLVGIHWEALRTMIKGIGFRANPHKLRELAPSQQCPQKARVRPAKIVRRAAGLTSV